jgi:hypothetical protein
MIPTNAIQIIAADAMSGAAHGSTDVDTSATQLGEFVQQLDRPQLIGLGDVARIASDAAS